MTYSISNFINIYLTYRTTLPTTTITAHSYEIISNYDQSLYRPTNFIVQRGIKGVVSSSAEMQRLQIAIANLTAGKSVRLG